MKGAVIGCGRMGAFTSESMAKFAPRCWFPLSHAEAIRMHPDLDLVALCDPNELSLKRAAEAYGVGNIYTDYRDLIEDAKPELIGIATRTLGRAEIIRCAAAGGVRAMHIEKPLCNTMRELQALTQTFANSDLYCSYGAIRRFFKIYQVARELAHSGKYGDLREIRVNMGEGMLYWTHPHSVDLILYFAGAQRAEAIQARLRNVVRGESPLEIASDPIIESASIYFEDGIAGHITGASGYAVILSCSGAEIAVENDGQSISISAPRGENPYFCTSAYQGTYNTPQSEGTYAPISHLVGCLAGDDAQRSSNVKLKADILRGQRILFAIVQSHLEQSRLVREQDIDPEIAILAKTGEKFA